MKLKPSTYFALIVMAVMLAVIGKALTFRYYQSAILPVTVGSLVVILTGIQVWREILGKGAAKAEDKHRAKGEEIEYTKGMNLGVFAAWFFGFCLAIYALGHLIAVVLFCLTYVKSRGKSWVNAVAAAACITIFIYLLFPLAFKVELYPGLIYEYIFEG